MTVSRKEKVLASLLWGGVAAVGEFTMLFLSIIGRIHVTFANQAPVFTVDPRGPISLTKDSALTVVWALTFVYGALVAVMTYLGAARVRPFRTTLIICFLSAALVAALAEPLWGLALTASLAVLYPLLK